LLDCKGKHTRTHTGDKYWIVHVHRVTEW